MDYVKEIERIQREQEQRLRLGQGLPPDLKGGAKVAQETLARVTAQPATHPVAAAVAQVRDRHAQARSRAGSSSTVKTAASDAATQRVAASIVGFVLLVPVMFLLGMGLSAIEGAWDGQFLDPMETLFVVGPLVMAAAALTLRKHVMSAVLRGGKPAPAGTPALGSRLKWVGPVIAGLVAAAVAASMFFPQGLPLREWVEQALAGTL